MVTISNKLVSIDTNIFVYFFQQHKQFGVAAKSLFELMAQKQTRAVTSIITLTELLSIPTSEEVTEELTARFLETPNLIISEINQTIALDAARIRRLYGIRTPDALQLATALFHKSDFFITSDQRLKSFKDLSIIILNQTTQFDLPKKS